AMEVLIASAAAPRDHVHHPEVVGVRADGVQRLPEADFDAETVAVKGEHLQRIERQVCGHEEQTPPPGMINPHEAHEAADGTPAKILGVIADADAALTRDRARGRAEAVTIVPEVLEVPLGSIGTRSATTPLARLHWLLV